MIRPAYSPVVGTVSPGGRINFPATTEKPVRFTLEKKP